MISLLLSLMLCMTSCKAPVSESFVEAYKMYEKKHYNRFHRLARRRTSEHINKRDSLIFVPYLTVRKEVIHEWGFTVDTRSNNAKYASWEYLDYEKIPHEFIVYADNKCVKYYRDASILRQKRKFYAFNTSVTEEIMGMVTRYRPDGVFTVCSIPGWFFIIGEDIVYIDPRHQIYREDALAEIKDNFTEPYFWVVFSWHGR